MTTQFPDSIPDTTTTLQPAAHRVTAVPARPFAAVFQAGADAVIDGAEAAAQRLPGGPLVSAALRPGLPTGSMPSTLGTPTGAATDPSGTTDVGITQDPLQAAADAQTQTTVELLTLQHQIQEENRRYTTYSNVLKARHETMKNAIGNIR